MGDWSKLTKYHMGREDGTTNIDKTETTAFLEVK